MARRVSSRSRAGSRVVGRVAARRDRPGWASFSRSGDPDRRAQLPAQGLARPAPRVTVGGRSPGRSGPGRESRCSCALRRPRAEGLGDLAQDPGAGREHGPRRRRGRDQGESRSSGWSPGCRGPAGTAARCRARPRTTASVVRIRSDFLHQVDQGLPGGRAHQRVRVAQRLGAGQRVRPRRRPAARRPDRPRSCSASRSWRPSPCARRRRRLSAQEDTTSAPCHRPPASTRTARQRRVRRAERDGAGDQHRDGPLQGDHDGGRARARRRRRPRRHHSMITGTRAQGMPNAAAPPTKVEIAMPGHGQADQQDPGAGDALEGDHPGRQRRRARRTCRTRRDGWRCR